eukprot:965745-Prorocentrum_minimum.AAC.1
MLRSRGVECALAVIGTGGPGVRVLAAAVHGPGGGEGRGAGGEAHHQRRLAPAGHPHAGGAAGQHRHPRLRLPQAPGG